MKRKETNAVAEAVAAAEAELAQVDPEQPDAALPHLRAAQEHLTAAVDEAMAAVIVESGSSIRSAGMLAGLSENAVGPRLARTSLLAAYGSESGRVTASGVERARYDLEQGRHRTADPAEGAPANRPMRFRARRTT
ncbi:hypothetical protein [Knoellia sp. p5-6-4]|uniref:hypothetical protein n=1 Tax=unclassified Knoellia TaxID=2618719 RepID=UPI0023DBE2A7|nr:hypothetical protein [Knoellia sp. p5-6-4]MDF2145011.1 hypothetical protein [Knoellia sp. p5-6-4]